MTSTTVAPAPAASGLDAPFSAPFRVAAVQTVTGIDVDANLARADALLAEAAGQGAQLALLPEYFCMMGRKDSDKVAIREDDHDGPIQAFLADAAQRHKLWLVGGTLPLWCEDEQRVRNTSLAYNPAGQRVARYDKIHLFNFVRGEERYDEARTIEPGATPVAFDAPCGRVGMSVCYDLRFPELYRALSAQGNLNLILMPAAFTYVTG
ncbi:nitrilase-related carbon-nitrogen hydrolase, partial [uncultured Ralstonia sp.]